jgi:hypothetical protein
MPARLRTPACSRPARRAIAPSSTTFFLLERKHEAQLPQIECQRDAGLNDALRRQQGRQGLETNRCGAAGKDYTAFAVATWTRQGR